MANILVCGFEPYGGRPDNPAGDLALALGKQAGIRAAVLPVSYAQSGGALVTQLAEKPAAVLLLGMWQGSTVKLERLALNLDDSDQADADGVIRLGERIVAGGPAAYWSSLPLQRFEQALTRAGLPVRWSRDAGGYVCNHVFYLAAHRLAPTATPCGLIHVPVNLAVTDQLAGLRDCIANWQLD